MDEVTKNLVMIVNNCSPGNLTLDEVSRLVEELKLLIREPHSYEVQKKKNAGRARARS